MLVIKEFLLLNTCLQPVRAQSVVCQSAETGLLLLSKLFIMLQPGGCQEASSFTIKVLDASLFVHLLELRTATFNSVKRALKKNAAQYELQEPPITSFLLNTGTSVYYQDDLFNRILACKLLWSW